MNQIHTTKDGEQMRISEMEDSHLINTIVLKIKQAFELKELIEKPQTSRGIIDEVLYNRVRVDLRQAAEALARVIESIEPYLLELWIRDLEIPKFRKTQLQDVLGRKNKLPKESITRMALLLRGSIVEDTASYDEDWMGDADDRDPDEGDR